LGVPCQFLLFSLDFVRTVLNGVIFILSFFGYQLVHFIFLSPLPDFS